MGSIKDELARYGRKIYQAHLVVGAGGNISARDGEIIWMKPSGLAMDEIAPEDVCGMELATGRQVEGPHKPTSEVNVKQTFYRSLIGEDAAKSLVAAAVVGWPASAGARASRNGFSPFFSIRPGLSPGTYFRNIRQNLPKFSRAPEPNLRASPPAQSSRRGTGAGISGPACRLSKRTFAPPRRRFAHEVAQHRTCRRFPAHRSPRLGPEPQGH